MQSRPQNCVHVGVPVSGCYMCSYTFASCRTHSLCHLKQVYNNKIEDLQDGHACSPRMVLGLKLAPVLHVCSVLPQRVIQSRTSSFHRRS